MMTMIEYFATLAVLFVQDHYLYSAVAGCILIIYFFTSTTSVWFITIGALLSLIAFSPLYFTTHLGNANTPINVSQEAVSTLSSETKQRITDFETTAAQHDIELLDSKDDITEKMLIEWVKLSKTKIKLENDIANELNQHKRAE
jgi:uncharacterized membrane protein